LRRALLALAAVALLALLIWWGPGERPARSKQAKAPDDAPAAREEISTPEPEPAPAAAQATSPNPDPVEHGECVLFLHVVDADTGNPVASTVDLWRLDAPGNADWTEGDQIQVTAEIPVEGAKLEALPAGVYRPRCLAERYSAEDPTPLRVAGPLTEVTIPIQMPREFRAYVKVVDSRGALVPRGSLRRGWRFWHDRSRNPAWRRPRRLRGPEPRVGRGARGGGGGGGGRSATAPQPPDGFPLGPSPEDSKKSCTTYGFSIEVEGANDVSVCVPGEATDGVTFLGLAVPLETVTGDLRMPDGRTIAEAGGTVDVSFDAVELKPSAPSPTLVDLPFHIRVTVPGKKTLSFDRKLGEPAPALVFEEASATR
jgi:hypothetical protein